MEVSRVRDCVAWRCQEFMTVLHGGVKSSGLCCMEVSVVHDCVAWRCQEFMTVLHGGVKSS